MHWEGRVLLQTQTSKGLKNTLTFKNKIFILG